MNRINAFTIPIFEDYLNPDMMEINDLRKDENIIHSGFQKNFQAQGYDITKFRILNKYPNIRKEITDKFQKLHFDLYKRDCKPMLSTSWLVKLDKDEYIHKHDHANVQWSGLFYYGSDYEGACPLVFANPMWEMFAYTLDYPGTEHTHFLSDYQIAPKPLKIIFFPAFIKHMSLIPNLVTRVSLAFNFIPTKNLMNGDSQIDMDWFNG